MKLRDVIGAVKDKVSQSKAALFGSALSHHLAILRATTHAPHVPPEDRHLTALLSLGDSSRATASALVEVLMDRLHRTGSSAVALKCLLTIHHVIKRGAFILQDQLSVFPASGGRNYLNLSAFRDGSTAATWVLSAWVRYYARYLETLLSTSRTLGFFLCSSSCEQRKEIQEPRISSVTNHDLIKDIDSLATLIEELCQAPDSILLERNMLLCEVKSFLTSDYLSAVNELSLRLTECNERLTCLGFSDSFELVCALEKLENCKARLDNLFAIKKPSTEMLWVLIDDLRNKVGKRSVCRRNMKLIDLGRREKGTESARFDARVEDYGDSVRFSSSRFELNKFPFMVLE